MPPAAPADDSDQRSLFARAQRVTPGGVHSPVRALAGVGGQPLFIASASGAALVDTNNQRYIDFCMAFGPLIFGHADADVKAAVIAALDRGWSYGTAETASLALAELITGRVPFAEQLRFVNSGTEAVMTALRLARAATGRDRVLKFDGCYHGHTDAMLIRAGSGLADLAEADSAGVPAGVTRDTLVAPLNDDAALETMFQQHGGSLAAVIIEPVPANYGLLPQREAFLRQLADRCRRNGSLLIFDEVITGFRLGFGGYAEVSGLAPDLVTWGKIIGGGFPVGAIGGRRELMELLAPSGPVYQAGTLSANPVAMAAGLATLHKLEDGSAYRQLEDLGRYLDASLGQMTGLRLQRAGSLFWIAAGANPQQMIRSKADIPATAVECYPALFRQALGAGLYLPPSPCEVGFLSLAHDTADIDRLTAVIQRFLTDTVS